MAMTARQLGGIFGDIVKKEDLRSVVTKHRGNIEKSFDDVMRHIPKEKRTAKLCETLWSRLKPYWRVRTEGLAIQESASMSITVAQLGTLHKYECVKAKDFNETKLGKLWIKHSRGWSMATRKGEVFMKQITKPYALVDIERQLAEKKEAAKLKSKKELSEKKEKKKKSKKSTPSSKSNEAPYDPFAAAAQKNADSEDPFVAAATGRKGSKKTSKKATRASAQSFGSTGTAGLEDIFGTTSQPKASARSGRATSATTTSASLAAAFETNNNSNNEEKELDLLSQAMGAHSPDVSRNHQPTSNVMGKEEKEEDKDVWSGGDLFNFDDPMTAPTKAPKKKMTMQELQGEAISFM